MTPHEFAIQVVKKLQQEGHEALWAGGCVRDRLLKNEPKDFDVATSARPDQIREIFGYKKTIAIGASFGVITVIGPKSVGVIEVATFRNDGTYSDGRHPDTVEFSTAEQDAQRRDFTINGLFYDPVADKVIDYVDGRADLERKTIRAIGEPADRIHEDKLRMLRAVRFSSTLDFDLDPATADAIRHNAAQIKVVSAERIGAELKRMLTHPGRQVAVELLRDVQLLAEILPAEIVGKPEFETWPSTTTLKILKALGETDFSIALSVLFRELISDPSEIELVCRSWRLSLDEIKQSTWLIQNEPFIRKASSLEWPKLQRILIQPYALSAIELATAIVTVTPENSERASIELCQQKLALSNDKLNPQPLLTGDDLVQIGMEPGPKFKSLIDQVRDAQLLDQIGTKSEAIELAKKIAAK